MKLHPFQEEGRDFLAARKVALLADEMRLGKTAQAISAARLVGAENAVVVCPAVAQSHWHASWREWWPDGPAPRVYSYHFLTTHLTKIRKLVGRPDVLIVDESHYCKSRDARRTKAVFGKAGLAHHAARTWCLTGTPVPNNVSELWPFLRTCGLVGTYGGFVARYCWFTPTGDIGGSRKDRMGELRELMRPVTLRRRTAQVAPQLPKAAVYPWHVDAVLTDDLLEEVGLVKDEIQGMTPSEVADWLQHNAPHLARLRIWTALAKVPAVAADLNESLREGGGPFVVFGYHRAPLEALGRALQHPWSMIHGGVPPAEREAELRAFREGKTRVFIGQLHAAGTAIDLSVACDGVLLERDWVPGVNAQALERMGGWKQTRPVVVREAIAAGTLDEVVRNVTTRKQGEIEDLVE